jgi:hypothetical protein
VHPGRARRHLKIVNTGRVLALILLAVIFLALGTLEILAARNHGPDGGSETTGSAAGPAWPLK